MKSSKQISTFLISRTDSIGDVVLTIPLLGLLREHNPNARLVFLGQSYTRAVADACENIDEFVDWTEISKLPDAEQLNQFKAIGADVIIHVFPRKEIARLAFRAKIPLRVGATGRIFHLRTCNRLMVLSRRRSILHEAQLNLKLARNFIRSPLPQPDELPDYYGLTQIEPLPEEIGKLIDPSRFNLILHPKSKGSAREWGTANFAELARLLPAEKFRVFITGTQAEGDLLRGEGFFDSSGTVTDLTGKLSLSELLGFIAKADGLIAASTGPLHLAAAMGRVALGIYPPIKPMHPGRWAPIGKKASFVVTDKPCEQCRNSGPCFCMIKIRPAFVYQKLLSMISPKNSENGKKQ